MARTIPPEQMSPRRYAVVRFMGELFEGHDEREVGLALDGLADRNRAPMQRYLTKIGMYAELSSLITGLSSGDFLLQPTYVQNGLIRHAQLWWALPKAPCDTKLMFCTDESFLDAFPLPKGWSEREDAINDYKSLILAQLEVGTISSAPCAKLEMDLRRVFGL